MKKITSSFLSALLIVSCMASQVFAETVNLVGTVNPTSSVSINNSAGANFNLSSGDLNNTQIFDAVVNSNNTAGWTLSFTSLKDGLLERTAPSTATKAYTVQTGSIIGTLGTSRILTNNLLTATTLDATTPTTISAGTGTSNTLNYTIPIHITVTSVNDMLPGTYTDTITVTAANQ